MHEWLLLYWKWMQCLQYIPHSCLPNLCFFDPLPFMLDKLHYLPRTMHLPATILSLFSFNMRSLPNWLFAMYLSHSLHHLRHNQQLHNDRYDV